MFAEYTIEPVHEKYAWRICDFMVANADRFKRFFPQTLNQNLNPELSRIFVNDKVRQFEQREEFLFVLKMKNDRRVIGLVYIKRVDWEKKEAELAYCIGYTHEGKGWMTEAVQYLSAYALNKLGLSTLRIIVHKSKPASIKVAQNCGYLWKSTLEKEHAPRGEAPLDMELYVLEKLAV